MNTDIAGEELADFAHQREPYAAVQWMDDRITLFLERNIVIARTETDSNEVLDDGQVLTTGSGPEWASVHTSDNPNWIRNRAINLLNLADYLENREAVLAAKKAEAEAARDMRRNELANEFAPRDFALGPNFYSNVSEGLRCAIDRIIEMEAAK